MITYMQAWHVSPIMCTQVVVPGVARMGEVVVLGGQEELCLQLQPSLGYLMGLPLLTWVFLGLRAWVPLQHLLREPSQKVALQTRLGLLVSARVQLSMLAYCEAHRHISLTLSLTLFHVPLL
jgi:hypothetical protein